MSLKGKNALITGSARGLGKSMAMALAKEGVNIIINDIEVMKEDALKTVAELKGMGVNADFIPADVSNFESCKKLAEGIKSKFGKLDILINNAGITKDRTLKKMSPDEWNAVISVNLNSMYNVTHNLLAIDLIPEGGRIVNIASIVAFMGNFGQCNYSATKGAVVSFTKTLSKELGKSKITVNAVAPGFIKSAMTDKIPMEMLATMLQLIPLREIGQPEDVANVVKFLCSDDAKYITGETIKIDGGLY